MLWLNLFFPLRGQHARISQSKVKTLLNSSFGSRDKYLGSNCSSVKIELGVGELVARVDGEGLGVKVVRLRPLRALEGRVTVLLLLTQELGFLNVAKKKIIC